MGDSKRRKLPYPGMRNIKTAVSIFICLLLYNVMDRDGMVLASIACLICMQDSVEKTFIEGSNRIAGTIIGGLFGIFFTLMNFDTKPYFIWLLAFTFGLILLIYIFNLIGKKASISIGCVVYLIICIEKSDSAPTIYAINRVIDTIIGIVISLLVNRFLYAPTPERLATKHREELSVDINYELRRNRQHKTSKWSGGETTEIFIFPKKCFYSERDFNWRLSSATVELEETTFTKLDGYLRHIMVLDGKMRLIHESQHAVNLEKYDQDFFDGSWNTKSIGKVKDFNLMYKEGLEGRLQCIKNDSTTNIVNKTEDDSRIFDVSAYYSLMDNVKFNLEKDEKTIFTEILNKGDFIIFAELSEYNENEILVKVNCDAASPDDVLLINSDIADNTFKVEEK